MTISMRCYLVIPRWFQHELPWEIDGTAMGLRSTGPDSMRLQIVRMICTRHRARVVAVEALRFVSKLPHHVWGSACGRGAIVSVLREQGHTVWATDLVDYECPQSESGASISLMERRSRIDVGGDRHLTHRSRSSATRVCRARSSALSARS